MFAEHQKYLVKLLRTKQEIGSGRRKRHILHIALLLALGALSVQTSTAANKIAFSEGHWIGQRMTDVDQPGCMMEMQLDDDTAFAVFATAAGDFDLAFTSETWNIDDADGNVKAFLELDGQPVLFTRVFVPVSKAIIIKAMTHEDKAKLEQLFRKAEDMRVSFATLNYSAHTSFFDNHLAVTALKNCVRAAEREAKGSQ